MNVAIIANPASGKDIRRLVAHGSVFDNQEKVRMVRRILRGLTVTGVQNVLYMPDAYGIVERALEGMEQGDAPEHVTPVDFYLYNNQNDTIKCAGLMEEAGVSLIIVLGGDGTSRAVMKTARHTPILALSTGTNNVFPIMVESTVAGLAAGVLASGEVAMDEGTYPANYLDILVNDKVVDLALVDSAVYDGLFAGSRAIWNISDVSQIVVSRCRPDSIGLSAIAGLFDTIAPESPRGLALALDPLARCQVTAPIGPGLFSPVGIAEVTRLKPGDIVPVRTSPCVITVDGEREVEVLHGEHASIRLSTETIRIVDVAKTLEYARQRGVFIRSCENFGVPVHPIP